jgi:hypothetical protein
VNSEVVWFWGETTEKADLLFLIGEKWMNCHMFFIIVLKNPAKNYSNERKPPLKGNKF